MGNAVDIVFNGFRDLYERASTRKTVASGLLTGLVAALVLIEANRQGWLPASLAGRLPTNHFVAVEWIVDVLLVFELVELILGLARSVSGSLGKQLEVFALILLRKSFEELKYFPEPIDLKTLGSLFAMDPAVQPIFHMAADALGALVVFGGLVLFRKIQRHRVITTSKRDQTHFVSAKKLIAVVMLVGMLVVGVEEIVRAVHTGQGPTHFFSAVFTGLIFSDIAIVLVSLRYTAQFRVVFRNFGYTAVTVFLRLAITAAPFSRAALAVFVVSFAIALAWMYNLAAPDVQEASETPERASGVPEKQTSLHAESVDTGVPGA